MVKKLARLFLGGIAIGLLALSGWKAYPRLRPAPETATAQHWVCPMRCLHRTYDHPGVCPVCHMKLIPLDQPPGGKLLGYTCPLHYSQTVFDKPGRCPFCTLQLKAIYEGGQRETKHFDIAAWPSVGDKMAVYFRPYDVRQVQVDRLLRVAGSVSRDGRHLSAKLPVGAEAPRKGATAMIMPAVGYSRPALGSVESVSHDGRLAIKIPKAINGFPQVTAEIRLPGPLVLAVPVEAIDESGSQARVFVRTGSGDREVYEPRAVKLGQRGESFVEVLSGLKEGESVAGSGVFWLEAQWRMDHPDSGPSL
jgi:hypothetical protein